MGGERKGGGEKEGEGERGGEGEKGEGGQGGELLCLDAVHGRHGDGKGEGRGRGRGVWGGPTIVAQDEYLNFILPRDPKADLDEGGCVFGATGFSRIVVSTSVEASDRGAKKCRSIAAPEGGASRPTLTDGSGRCGPPICSVLTSGDLLRAQPLPRRRRRRRRRRREATRDQRLFLKELAVHWRSPSATGGAW